MVSGQLDTSERIIVGLRVPSSDDRMKHFCPCLHSNRWPCPEQITLLTGYPGYSFLTLEMSCLISFTSKVKTRVSPPRDMTVRCLNLCLVFTKSMELLNPPVHPPPPDQTHTHILLAISIKFIM